MASDAAPTASKKDRIPGQSFLPLARVKRIIKEDPDVSLVNAEATHCIASATELFMEYLVSEGFSRAQKNKRKTIFYKDLASAVSQTDAFEFLEDVIPQTVTLEEAYKRRQRADDGTNGSAGTGKGEQSTATKRRKLQDKLNAQQPSELKDTDTQEQDDNDEADEDEVEDEEEEVDDDDEEEVEEEEEHDEDEEDEEEE